MNIFKNVSPAKLKRNPFNLSHDVKLTTDFGRLTPILCKEVVPGDTFRLRSEMLVRTAPLFAPLMHKVNCYVHYFFVPTRLLMSNWDTWITGGENGDGSITERFATLPHDVVKPRVKFSELVDWYEDANSQKQIFGESSLFDYLGFPALTDEEIEHINDMKDPLYSEQPVDLMPYKVYQLIYNEYYRDENFEPEVDIFKDVEGDLFDYLNDALNNGADATQVGEMVNAFFKLHQRNWEKDYFTSALPWPQRGEDTTLGDGSTGDITISSKSYGQTQGVQIDMSDPNDLSGAFSVGQLASKLQATQEPGGVVSINELRRALAVQKFKERSARYGARLTEFLRGFFGVRPDDARLQRPQFLGGFKQQVQFGEVLQTSETTNESPQGAYAGTGFSLSGGKYIRGHFKEHGYIMGILSVMPKPAYMQGWPREYDRFDKFDYYLPDFANIGEQGIKKQELNWLPYALSGMQTNSDAINAQVFGYQSRYAEYKYSPSRVHGQMRSTLDFWHMARRVADNQNLNRTFLELNQTEMDRVFNVVGDSSGIYDHLWLQIYHDIKAIRPMPKFGTPML